MSKCTFLKQPGIHAPAQAFKSLTTASCVCICVLCVLTHVSCHCRLDVSWLVEHLTITTGKDLESTRIAFVLVYLSCLFAFVITIIICIPTWSRLGDERNGQGVLGDGKGNPVHGHSRFNQFVLCGIDFILILVTVIIAATRHSQIESSRADIESSIGSM